ncbi:hypothetical protein OHC33_007351 [Knufia fluminis]|uniref:NACHT domain-containing protein n=1 Tax=Knufia fluminis TaxID=191047 RepID=A0AAN8EIK8_9EURO|nr:hypothetical protein OHC33_007351 [Knufia fluminis]
MTAGMIAKHQRPVDGVSALPFPSLPPNPPSTGDLHISGNAIVHLGDNYTNNGNDSEAKTYQKLLTSLSYPHMYDRRQQISSAYPDTYQWMLQPLGQEVQQWNCFTTWLHEPRCKPDIYWIQGKPGSGKSTMMKFLYRSLTVQDRLDAWSNERPLMKVQHFFWNSGTLLQKSLTGFYRSLLAQIVEQRPDMVEHVVLTLRKNGSGVSTAGWDGKELNEALLVVVEALCTSVRLILIVDGLDECDGTDLEQEELGDFLTAVAAFDHVKISRHDYLRAAYLVRDIIDRSEGVFLWPRGITPEIASRPQDLDDYFMRIIESIDPQHRRESSALLQLALYEEERFASVFSLRLVDTFFIAQQHEDFVLRPDFDIHSLGFENEHSLLGLLDGAIRKLNSRCRGLLECVDEDMGCISSGNFEAYTRKFGEASSYSERLDRFFSINVEFLHRSLREFLSLPRTEMILHQYTGGRPVDAELYFCSARVVQLMALDRIRHGSELSIGLASHVMSALWANDLSQASASMASIIREAVERLATVEQGPDYWYITKSFVSWHEEQGNFLSLAIDFGLTSYVLESINGHSVQGKLGRPILDYILRPRWVITLHSPNSPWVDQNVITAALACGANPNQRITENGPSVWALYLCFLADHIKDIRENRNGTKQLSSYQALSALISAGAALILPLQWLVSSTLHNSVASSLRRNDGFPFDAETDEIRFRRRWPGVRPVPSTLSAGVGQKTELAFAASDLVQSLSRGFGFDIRPLVQELRRMERGHGVI